MISASSRTTRYHPTCCTFRAIHAYFFANNAVRPDYCSLRVIHASPLEYCSALRVIDTSSRTNATYPTAVPFARLLPPFETRNTQEAGAVPRDSPRQTRARQSGGGAPRGRGGDCDEGHGGMHTTRAFPFYGQIMMGVGVWEV